MKVVIGVTLMLGSFIAQAQAPRSAEEWQQCAAKNVPEKSFEQAAKLIVKQGERVQRTIAASFAGARGKSGFLLNIGVQKPADVSGTTVLLRENGNGRDDLKLYLPALRRVRSVSGAMAGNSLLGTDFSYADIKQIYGVFSGSQLALNEAQIWHERKMQRLSVVPEEPESPYTRIVVGLDEETCVPLLVEFEGEQSDVIKRLEGDFSSLREVQGHRLLSRYTMVNVPENSATDLSLGTPRFDTNIARSAFHPATFYNFRNTAERPE